MNGFFFVLRGESVPKNYVGSTRRDDDRMSLNTFRDKTADFLRMVDPQGRESDATLLAMLEEKCGKLKMSAGKPDQLSHRIYDVLFLLFEIAAKHRCDLDAEWEAGRIRKRKYTRVNK